MLLLTIWRKYQQSHHDSPQLHHVKFQTKEHKFSRIAGVGAAVAALIYGLKNYDAEERKNSILSEDAVGSFIEGLPVYTSDDVAKHQDEKSGIWISYKNGVYDITSFANNHPGELIDVLCPRTHSTHFGCRWNKNSAGSW